MQIPFVNSAKSSGNRDWGLVKQELVKQELHLGLFDIQLM
jgi:hypothetical protein